MRIFDRRDRQVILWAGLIATHAVFGWAALWAGYDFRFSARASPADPGLLFFADRPGDAVRLNRPMAAAIAWCRRSHFLPEGWLHNVGNFSVINQEHPAFMDGRWKHGGWRTFFPYGFWVKTPPALLLLLPLGLAVWWWRGHRPTAEAGFTDPAPPLYAATPLLALFAVYAAAAIVQNLNIGHRHILPLYPVLYILAGSAALGWTARPAWVKGAVAALAGWFVFDSLAIRPHYLAYFNAFAGGPAQGHRHLVDSSLDWGMDLPGLKQWLDLHNPKDRRPFFLAYFGTGSPEYYGIKSRRLPGFLDWRQPVIHPLEPGFYAISATLFESVRTQTFGPWNRVYENAFQAAMAKRRALVRSAGDPARRAALREAYPQKLGDGQDDAFDHLRFGRLCAWLRARRPPDDTVGYSILIWSLSEADIQAALYGAPVELDDQPAG